MSRLVGLSVVLASALASAEDVPPPPQSPDAGVEPMPAEEPPPPSDATTAAPVTLDAPSPSGRTITVTRAEPAATELSSADTGSPGVAPPDLGVQSIGGGLGVAGGGRVTPGGLRIVGHYLYQLTAQDWFDGSVGFTFGSGGPGCFRDRDDIVVCDHGLTDGAGVEIAANIRRFLGGRDEFWPFLRFGVGIALARYSDDELTGFALPFHAGGGVRVAITEDVAVVVEAAVDLGFGGFTRGLGLEPVLGGSVTAGAEFPL